MTLTFYVKDLDEHKSFVKQKMSWHRVQETSCFQTADLKAEWSMYEIIDYKNSARTGAGPLLFPKCKHSYVGVITVSHWK